MKRFTRALSASALALSISLITIAGCGKVRQEAPSASPSPVPSAAPVTVIETPRLMDKEYLLRMDREVHAGLKHFDDEEAQARAERQKLALAEQDRKQQAEIAQVQAHLTDLKKKAAKKKIK